MYDATLNTVKPGTVKQVFHRGKFFEEGGFHRYAINHPLGSHWILDYIVVEDPDALHDRAVAAGAEILIGLKDEDYGGRGFTCRDPEGQLWNIGSYDPWAGAGR